MTLNQASKLLTNLYFKTMLFYFMICSDWVAKKVWSPAKREKTFQTRYSISHLFLFKLYWDHTGYTIKSKS